MSDPIRIVEVGPRDGLQNEKTPIATETKLAFIAALAAAGIREVEATSFVSPKWIPQLADANDLWRQLPTGPLYSALVPNLAGLERALSVGVERMALFTAASDAFTERNIRMTVDQSLTVFAEVASRFRQAKPNGWIRGYVSTAFECPYAGRIPISQVIEVTGRLIDIGVNEVSIGDTIGVAAPIEVRGLTTALLREFPSERIAMHFHDTNGLAVANVVEAIDRGIRCFDASAGGLGGCPYAPGASGNLATEDLVYLLERSGWHTGIDLDELSRASLIVLEALGRPPAAKAQVAQLASASGTSPT
ncbi:MAG: hydroxymethylglutaryl-CoA lyase [Fimbriimonas sp.]|nr:hydroxymethylglutaryl-CoA lyase [Fimbriimonas sp.]